RPKVGPTLVRPYWVSLRGSDGDRSGGTGKRLEWGPPGPRRDRRMSRIIVSPVIRVNLVEYLLKTKPEEVEAVGRNNLLRAARLFRTPALGELYSQAFTLEREARDRLTTELEAEGIMAFIPSRNIRLYARPNEIFVGLEGAGPDYPGNPQNQPVAYEATKEVARELFEAEAQWAERRERVWGRSTGFPSWDEITGGLHPGEVTVLGARQSSGKTALALQVTLAVAQELDQSQEPAQVVYVTPEMTD